MTEQIDMTKQIDTFENLNLAPDERAGLLLRGLYESAGYQRSKMNTFEEYSLYANNKEFFAGDSIATFTNLDGRLMALKPDVTMSIIRSADIKANQTIRVYYNDTVYREDRRGATFVEVPQIGLECIGKVQEPEIREVLLLAARTLDTVDDHFVLTFSHMSYVEELLDSMELDRNLYVHILRLMRSKNIDGIRKVARKGGVPAANITKLCAVPKLYGPAEKVLKKAAKYVITEPMQEAMDQLADLVRTLEGEGFGDKIQLDLSMTNDIDYYNGIIFKGYLKGLSTNVLGGGQYDRAMKRFSKSGGGVGFALYLNAITRLEEAKAKEDRPLTIALPKGRLGDQVHDLLTRSGYDCPAYKDKNRKLIIESADGTLRYILVKPSDVPVYVERGAADLGIVGKDVLLEAEPDVYELMDLDIGKCRMCVAAKEGYVDDPGKVLRVATKFVNVAKEYYRGQHRDIDIIKLNGSIELGPILEMTDVIVDLVETGNTIRENHLEIVDEFRQISARLICNTSSHRFRNGEIKELVSALMATQKADKEKEKEERKAQRAKAAGKTAKSK